MDLSGQFKDLHSYHIGLLNLESVLYFLARHILSKMEGMNGCTAILRQLALKPPVYDLKARQRRLNQFVKEYGHVRPHEALGVETPASAHQFSTRPFPEIIREFEYNPEFKIMKVTQNGAIRWKSYYWVYLTVALKGKYVGAEELGNGIWRIYYYRVFLWYFDDSNISNKYQ